MGPRSALQCVTVVRTPLPDPRAYAEAYLLGYMQGRSQCVQDRSRSSWQPGRERLWWRSSGGAVRGRKIYFALYQALEKGDEQELFRRYEPDYFAIVNLSDLCPVG